VGRVKIKRKKRVMGIEKRGVGKIKGKKGEMIEKMVRET
jgi:hypothetical protein